MRKILRNLASRILTGAPSTDTINLTGVVWSDYRLIGGKWVKEDKRGWVKGWVVESPRRNIIVTAKHCMPSAGAPQNLVQVYDKDGFKCVRYIEAVEPLDYDLGNDSITSSAFKGDIAICRVSRPFPKSIKAYSFAKDPVKRQMVFSVTPRGISRARISDLDPRYPWLVTEDRSDWLVAGDSGLPWFAWDRKEWRVIGHSTFGADGAGPWYTCPAIFEDLKERIKALSVARLDS